VIAHIGYSSESSPQKFQVNYGCWVEHELIMNIFRGHTRSLIIAVTDDDRKNFAVSDVGPATNYAQARMESVGEITPGEWKMLVTLSADNFRRDYVFDLTVGKDGSLVCNPEGIARPPQRQSPAKPGAAQPNVGSLRPEIATVVYDAESDMWSKGSDEGAISAALLPFSNEPKRLSKTVSVKGFRARLTYYKRDGIEEFRRIDSGCWVGEAYRYADLEVGDIAYLIAAIQGNGQTATVGNPRQSVARYDENHTVVDALPAGTYEIRVDLIAEDGEYAETYWSQLAVGEQLQVKRLNQRPAMTG
ncbi:MAG TPA: hypothetical protein VN939_15695, partial [Chthoniobacterales bacterium]|nr:hypothetical protein [Chthoniobacterales bacterium]